MVTSTAVKTSQGHVVRLVNGFCNGNFLTFGLLKRSDLEANIYQFPAYQLNEFMDLTSPDKPLNLQVDVICRLKDLTVFPKLMLLKPKGTELIATVLSNQQTKIDPKCARSSQQLFQPVCELLKAEFEKAEYKTLRAQHFPTIGVNVHVSDQAIIAKLMTLIGYN